MRAVRFGEKLASGVSVKSETEVTATAPAGNGTVDVAVITTQGKSATSAADKFTYTVTTLPNPPTVVTERAASVDAQTVATLNATVNPNGGEVSKCEFEYGTTDRYGNEATCALETGRDGTTARSLCQRRSRA